MFLPLLSFGGGNHSQGPAGLRGLRSLSAGIPQACSAFLFEVGFGWLGPGR